MGLLDQVIGGVTGKGGSTSPLTKALLMLLAAKAASSYFGRDGEAKAAGNDAPAPSPSGKIESGVLAGLPSLDTLLGRGDDTKSAGAPVPPSSPSDTIESGALAGFPSLDAVLDRLRGGGLGSRLDSWIGFGQNQPVQPDELGKALGQGTVDDLSRQTGMPKATLLQELSGVLPQVIDKLTPDGRMPGPKDRGHW